MYRIARLFIIVVVPILLSSCILTQEEENFVTVDVEADPGNAASLTYSYDAKNYSPVKDTLWVTNQVHIKLQGGFVYDLEVKINNDIFKPFGSAANPVSINKVNLSATYNIVTISQRVKSGTGSLADKSGYEYAEFHSQLVLVRDENSFVPKITNIAFQDGTVRVEWNAFNRNDFQNYKIVKSVSTINGYREYRSFTLPNSRRQNFFTDTTYVGGTINYQIVVNNGGAMTSETYPFNYTYKPDVSLTKMVGLFYLSFTRPPFYKNVKFYKTSFYNYNEQVNGQVITTRDVSPDNLMMNIPGPIVFGTGMKYEISPVAKVDVVGLGDQTILSGVTTYGTKIKKYNGSYVHDVKSAVYFCYVHNYTDGGGKMYKIADNNFEAIDSVSFPGTSINRIVISADGNYHYYLSDQKVIKFDPTTLSVISSTTFRDIKGFGGGDLSFAHKTATVTNTNFIYFSGDERGPFPCVVNMNTNTPLFTSTNRADDGHLSPDGTFLVIGSTVYKYTGSTYTFYQTLPYSNVSYRQFINNNPSQLFLATTTSIVIYDCQSKTELFSTAAQWVYYSIQFDQTSKKITAVDGLVRKVFDVPTRTMKTVYVATLSASFSGDTFFNSTPVNFSYFALKDYY